MPGRLRLSPRTIAPKRTPPAPQAPTPSKPKTLPPPLIGFATPRVLEPDDCLLRIWLPIRLTNGNTGRGGGWYQSHQFREECELQLKAWGLQRGPFQNAVTVRVLRILGPRQREWDSSSWQRGNWKEIEDALVSVGWFVNDSPKWIKESSCQQITDDRTNGPAIIIEIRTVS